MTSFLKFDLRSRRRRRGEEEEEEERQKGEEICLLLLMMVCWHKRTHNQQPFFFFFFFSLSLSLSFSYIYPLFRLTYFNLPSCLTLYLNVCACVCVCVWSWRFWNDRHLLYTRAGSCNIFHQWYSPAAVAAAGAAAMAVAAHSPAYGHDPYIFLLCLDHYNPLLAAFSQYSHIRV